MLVNVNIIEVTAIIANNEAFDKEATLLTLTSSNHCRFYHKRKNEESIKCCVCVCVCVCVCSWCSSLAGSR